MKLINKGGKHWAISGLWLNRKNWFYAIAGIHIAGACRVCLIVGTHGRWGLMIWDRYVCKSAQWEKARI